MLADVGELVHVDTRRGYQGQDLAGARFDGDEGAHLVLHELLPVLLEIRVDGGDDVVARDGLLVEFAILVGLLDLVVRVAEEDVVALLAAQFLFAGRLDAGHAGIVAAPIFARMLVDIGLVHLGNVAEEVAAGVDGVVPDAAHLAPEAGETVLDLGKAVVGLSRDLFEHRHTLKTDLAPVPAVFVHLAAQEFRRYVQDGGEGQRVESLHLARIHEDVVRHLVAHEDVPVPVVDDPAGREDHLPDRGIDVRIDLVVLVQDLDGENLRQEDDSDHSQTDQEFDMPAVRGHLRVSGARMSMMRRDTSTPATRDAPKRIAWKVSGRVPAPSAQI